MVEVGLVPVDAAPMCHNHGVSPALFPQEITPHAHRRRYRFVDGNRMVGSTLALS
jgi:hypothetical protein